MNSFNLKEEVARDLNEQAMVIHEVKKEGEWNIQENKK